MTSMRNFSNLRSSAFPAMNELVWRNCVSERIQEQQAAACDYSRAVTHPRWVSGRIILNAALIAALLIFAARLFAQPKIEIEHNQLPTDMQVILHQTTPRR